jgi:hypothetical protein
MKNVIFFSLLIIVLVTTGCTTVKTSISSISGNELNGDQKIFIMPGDQSVNVNDLLFIEFSNDIKLALKENGFIIVDNIEDANQVALLVYGVSDPKTRIISVPQFGPTSIKSSNTTGTIYSNGNYGNYRGSTTYNYNYGMTGVNNVAQTYFSRVIMITAIDLKKYIDEKILVQKWQTQLVSDGKNSDLRAVFPYMIFSAEKYMGKNTGKAITVSIIMNDKRVEKYLTN